MRCAGTMGRTLEQRGRSSVLRASAAAGLFGGLFIPRRGGQGKGGGHENDAPRGDKREEKNENPEKRFHSKTSQMFLSAAAPAYKPHGQGANETVSRRYAWEAGFTTSSISA